MSTFYIKDNYITVQPKNFFYYNNIFCSSKEGFDI